MGAHIEAHIEFRRSPSLSGFNWDTWAADVWFRRHSELFVLLGLMPDHEDVIYRRRGFPPDVSDSVARSDSYRMSVHEIDGPRASWITTAEAITIRDALAVRCPSEPHPDFNVVVETMLSIEKHLGPARLVYWFGT
jgi:hypothetical protein